MPDPSITPVKRQKAYAKRSKLGCRTCRHRRVKCDEFPGACKRCTSTGRQCDGYDLPPDSHKPFFATRIGIPQLTAPGILAALTLEERRGFSFFQHCTVPTLAGFYDSVLWEILSLQIGHADPAVCHSSIALSAVHCGVQARQRESLIPRAKTESRRWQQFAFEQMGRAFQQLRRRHASQDPQYTVTLLLCCLLFVAAEFTLGHYDNAFRHLRSGLRILRDQQIKVASGAQTPLEPSLTQTFAHLDNQAGCFGSEGPILVIDDDDDATLYSDMYPRNNVKNGRWTVTEVRQIMEPLAGAVVRFCRRQAITGYEESESAVSEQARIIHRLSLFLMFMNNLNDQPGRVLTAKENRGLKLLQLEAHALRNALLSLPVSTRKPQFHEFTDDFEIMLALAAEIQQCEKDSSHLPQITLDIGVVPPLYAIAKRTVDPEQRWRAIQLLQSYPHQEGPWNASLLSRTLIESLPAELSFAAKGAEDATGTVVAVGVRD
ncbi:Zn(II)2Cys6 transcription factor domain-containing protein [Aspergillus brunneoviolaceus CBS 621.78]|uniref:Uncharacterized protein n=1 Tax=Aspergillus brunneoviolaceus CBS 621.78 TaxID=1450534 RepID=A0ACD1GLA4_9EURO|nr:hypothetical protein BO95DRAFT_503163 [Aspergillus brunneoviolaceus CBS 621.78]RAH50046.1 hypothetical protein BO95DRAFT_503163 [Aspergillus brunneoviolaceus CBS 621.78]